jgi:hypothetical protein
MNFDDPSAWVQTANAFKGIFDGLRSAIGMVRELRASGGGSEAQQQLVDDALEKASQAAKVAEAHVAKALGYELCKCEFPPIPMRTVGRIDHPGIKKAGPVYECPKCGYNDSGGWAYNRIAPPWVPPPPEPSQPPD